MSEWYLELMRDSREALYRLIKHTEPGTGSYLHTAYAHLKQDIETKEQTRATDEWREAYDARRDAWRSLSRDERMHRVLNVIGDLALSVRAIAARFESEYPELSVYESDVRPLVYRLRDAGELDRREERHSSGSSRGFRYFRAQATDDTLASLEWALTDDETVA